MSPERAGADVPAPPGVRRDETRSSQGGRDPRLPRRALPRARTGHDRGRRRARAARPPAGGRPLSVRPVAPAAAVRRHAHRGRVHVRGNARGERHDPHPRPASHGRRARRRGSLGRDKRADDRFGRRGVRGRRVDAEAAALGRIELRPSRIERTASTIVGVTSSASSISACERHVVRDEDRPRADGARARRRPSPCRPRSAHSRGSTPSIDGGPQRRGRPRASGTRIRRPGRAGSATSGPSGPSSSSMPPWIRSRSSSPIEAARDPALVRHHGCRRSRRRAASGAPRAAPATGRTRSGSWLYGTSTTSVPSRSRSTARVGTSGRSAASARAARSSPRIRCATAANGIAALVSAIVAISSRRARPGRDPFGGEPRRRREPGRRGGSRDGRTSPGVRRPRRWPRPPPCRRAGGTSRAGRPHGPASARPWRRRIDASSALPACWRRLIQRSAGQPPDGSRAGCRAGAASPAAVTRSARSASSR